MASGQIPRNREYDAVVVGSGPNGLAAAITIAQMGCSVLLLEARETIGGGTRTRELTLPGYHHDVCSAIHPLALASPFFRSLDLGTTHGLEWIDPPIPLAHPLDDGSAVLLQRSLDATAEGLGRDGNAYRRLVGPAVQDWDKLVRDLLKPLGLPRYPLALLRFGPRAVRSAVGLAGTWFKGEQAKALFAGNSCHSILPLEHWSTAAFGLMLSMLGHAVGWPIVRGGSQAIADALASYLISLGGTINVEAPVSSFDDLPKARAFLFDVSPRQLARIAGSRFPVDYRKRLESYRYGPGVFKVDWALDGAIPWRDPACSQAGTVHLGGTIQEITSAELDVWRGVPPEKPFVLLSQPSLFDWSRAPEGMHTAWAYCHVPNGCSVDMTQRIEAQIERFAPGFRQRILAKHVMSPADIEEYNPNYVGGDIVGGVQSFRELFVRPLGQWRAYATPVKGIYICSSSMPPGGGVHGMCGYLAARKALREILGVRSDEPH
ncbi:MAG TPA: NAD(P)/FAD-dependent oxidoreductase [Syntrophorhabdales bacterium]|nr:NAD(P)/FAD-dependent oxidoreductase [Syntrophorhabdales bacterium]